MTVLDKIFSAEEFKKEDLALIHQKFKKVKFPKNAFLFEADKTADNYYFVEDGLIRSYAIDTKGQDISTGFYSHGEIAIDWPSFLLRQPTKEYYQALTPATCWQLDFASFQELFHKLEKFREGGRSRLAGSYFALKRRSISMITEQAKDRYLQLLKEKPELLQTVPLKQIATYLGITETSFSRIRKEIAG